MNFGRKNKDSQPQAVPTATVPVETTTPAPRHNPIVQYLIDSYNGIYKIVLEPSMPTKQTVILLIVGLIIGLLWGYQIAPKQFAGANPHRLNQAARDQWVLMVAGNYDRQFYNVDESARLLNQVENPTDAVNRLLASPNTNDSDRNALNQLAPIAATIAGTPAPENPGFVQDLLSGFIIPFLLILILTPILVVVWRLLIYSNFVAPVVNRIRESRDPALKARNDAARGDLKRLKEQRVELQKMKTASVADVELGDPVTQVLKVYQKGRPYDESDEIESGDDFLGQCGSVIPDSLGGDPVAVEVWLFDMFGTNTQNYKKLFVTELAANDPGVRNRLLTDEEVHAEDFVIAKPGAKIVIEAEKIRLQAELIAAEVGPSGRLDSFRMKVSAWKKDGRSVAPVSAPPPSFGSLMGTPAPAPTPSAAPLPTQAQPSFGSFGTPAPRPLAPQPLAPAPLGARPMSDYDDIDFDPPPSMPAPAPRPLGSPDFGAPPAYSPPNFRTEDDDPFGNTGDFTPLPPRN